jgi:hypothetical protein
LKSTTFGAIVVLPFNSEACDDGWNNESIL